MHGTINAFVPSAIRPLCALRRCVMGRALSEAGVQKRALRLCDCACSSSGMFNIPSLPPHPSSACLPQMLYRNWAPSAGEDASLFLSAYACATERVERPDASRSE